MDLAHFTSLPATLYHSGTQISRRIESFLSSLLSIRRVPDRKIHRSKTFLSANERDTTRIFGLRMLIAQLQVRFTEEIFNDGVLSGFVQEFSGDCGNRRTGVRATVAITIDS